MPSNSGYIALHIFKANCLHTSQWHLSATKSVSVSQMTFENYQPFSKLPQKKRKKKKKEGGKKNCFRKVYEQEEYHFHTQITPKCGFYKVPLRKNLL